MNRILLFAGTTEGRLLYEYCKEHKIPVTAVVATDYGEAVLPGSEAADIRVGRMDSRQMEELLHNSPYGLVIDATHPYAREVTENIRLACENCNTPYLRVLRKSFSEQTDPGVIYVDSLLEAADYLNCHEGNALITTGSKNLSVFSGVKDYTKRLTARILPDYENVKQCMEAGFSGRNLICMQGPFSEEFNLALLREIKASFLVTKESGTYGGFLEKVQAAGRAGAKVIVIKRPGTEEGYTLKETMEELESIINNHGA
jgi:precorrin-6x reductase